MKISEPEAGSVFVVTKRGSEAQGPQCTWPLLCLVNDDLSLQAFFVWRRCTPSGPNGGAFERQDHRPVPCVSPSSPGRRLDAQSQQPARTPDFKGERVVERVLLEYAAVRDGTELAEPGQDGEQVGDPRLDLDFALGASVSGHGSV